jgi:predicted TIM-barrel fold metal-dependent hydrolase
LLSKYKNACVDTSFQPPEAIRVLISAFGGDRVLFASDWAYGLRKPAILAVKEACGGDAGLLRAVLYDNAAELLNL